MVAIVLLLVSNVIFLELMTQADSGAGNLITFSQSPVIDLESLVFMIRFLTAQPKVPCTT